MYIVSLSFNNYTETSGVNLGVFTTLFKAKKFCYNYNKRYINSKLFIENFKTNYENHLDVSIDYVTYKNMVIPLYSYNSYSYL